MSFVINDFQLIKVTLVRWRVALPFLLFKGNPSKLHLRSGADLRLCEQECLVTRVSTLHVHGLEGCCTCISDKIRKGAVLLSKPLISKETVSLTEKGTVLWRPRLLIDQLVEKET